MANKNWLKRWGADVYAAELDDSDVKISGERDLGHCTIFTAEAPSVEDVTERGRGTDDYDTVIYSESGGLEQEIKITTKSDNVQNMMLMMFGEATDESQTAGNNTASPESVTAYLDEWSKLAGRNLDTETPPVVQDATDTTTYVENTDYEIDYTVGRIKPLSTGSITAGDVLHVGSTWLQQTLTQIEANRKMSRNFFLRVVGKDFIDNTWSEWEFDKVQLKPSGALSRITEPGQGNFQEFEMTGTIVTVDGKQWREIRHA